MTLRRTTKLRPFSDKRLRELAAAGVTNPTSTFTPKKPKMATAKRPKDTDPDKATVAAVMERDGGRCVGCGDPVCGQRGFHYSVHHRKLRSQGGDNRLSNLILLCGHGTSGCHGLAHSEVAAARLSGFLMLSTENPAEVRLDHSQHGPVHLLDDGSVVPIPAEARR